MCLSYIVVLYLHEACLSVCPYVKQISFVAII